MGTLSLTLHLPTDFSALQLSEAISKKCRITDFTYRINSQSLDARKKQDIHWVLSVCVFSDKIKGSNPAPNLPLNIPWEKRSKKVLVVGSGPAGFFSAYVLQKAGFSTTLIERGFDIERRTQSLLNFEKTGIFDPQGNYAFGEGGAGTFSDGKLTSRSKHISAEKQFILSTYIEAGAPQDIAWLTHPHLGSDHLRKIVKKLRVMFQSLGGTIQFNTQLLGLSSKNGSVTEAQTSSGPVKADYYIVASGHSAYETYRMLIQAGIAFRTKNFAIGSRVEHPQKLINQSQWGCESLPGIHAADYRLSSHSTEHLPVYTFCMCPGGTVVPSTAYPEMSCVNGMSLYQRDSFYANAACVAAVNLNALLGKLVEPLEALGWVESLERQFYDDSKSYRIPACSIQDFIKGKLEDSLPQSSFCFGLHPAALWELLPSPISEALRAGLIDFSRKLRGFEKGVIMGLESKTSAPIQAIRDEHRRCIGFSNLYMIGEGSGYSGGIISSAADGVRTALQIMSEA